MAAECFVSRAPARPLRRTPPMRSGPCRPTGPPAVASSSCRILPADPDDDCRNCVLLFQHAATGCRNRVIRCVRARQGDRSAPVAVTIHAERLPSARLLSFVAMTSQNAPAARPALAATSLAALGVVFGDIGTSPLYTLKTVLDLMGRHEPLAVLGALSLIVWTLIVVTTVKYVGFAMRVDNDGEGGILALMSLLGVKRGRPIIVAVGLAGAALIYGDGAVTP